MYFGLYIERDLSTNNVNSVQDSVTSMEQDTRSMMQTGRRARGRPRKVIDENPLADKARTRGRESQRAFRLRQRAVVEMLERRTISLEDAIEAMSNEFMALGEHITRRARIIDQPEVLVEIKERTKRFLDIARSVEPVILDNDIPPYMVPVPDSSAAQISENASISSAGQKLPNPNLDPQLATDLTRVDTGNYSLDLTRINQGSRHHIVDTDQDQESRQSFYTVTGSFSPRLDYGLFGKSPSQSNTMTTIPWSQYLIAGPNSFAMRLYTDTLTTAVKAIQGEITISGFLPSVCRYRFRYERPDTLVDIIRQQLASVSPSTIEPGIASMMRERDQSLALLGPSDYTRIGLMAVLVSDAKQDLGSLDDWLDPWDAQQYIGEKWGIELTGTTAAIPRSTLKPSNTTAISQRNVAEDPPYLDVLGTEPSLLNTDSSSFSELLTSDAEVETQASKIHQISATNHSVVEPMESIYPAPPATVYGAHSLLAQLKSSALCFGDGPRFFKPEIDVVVEQFLEECRLYG